MQRKNNSDRLFWTGIGTAIIVFLLAISITPTVIAQTRTETERLLDRFEDVFEFVRDNYVEEIDPDVLIEGALRGLFESLGDPHSAYLDEEELDTLTEQTTGEFAGVGMYISKDTGSDDSTEYIIVQSPIEGTPAFRAGVRAGDLITAVDGESTVEMSTDEAADKIRGPVGTRVTISILRNSRTEIELEIERAIVEIPSVRYEMIGPDIGFVRIIRFSQHTLESLDQAIEHFEQNGYEAMIIDVRSNPGGLLSSVIDVADLFFERGTIVATAGRDPINDTRALAKPGMRVPEEIPIAVLINEGSASASEILAGVMQDRNRAELLGVTTFGKGSVQQLHVVGDGGFRLTMSRYYLPSGRSIDEVGVDPDIVVEEPELSEEETEVYFDLLESGRISDWVSDNRNPSDAEVQRYIDSLQDEGIALEDRWLRRMVREEVLYQNNETAVYDLEFDVVLQRAVELLREGEPGPR